MAHCIRSTSDSTENFGSDDRSALSDPSLKIPLRMVADLGVLTTRAEVAYKAWMALSNQDLEI